MPRGLGGYYALGLTRALGGALIAPVAYELLPETSRDVASFIFLDIGAIVFYASTVLLEGERRGGTEGERVRADGKDTSPRRDARCYPRTMMLGMSSPSRVL